ncbi:MAG TPA: hypothetical protein VIK52_06605 [Opitutaceae bacterium]
MTTGGWITMLLSVGFVVVLFLWCIIKVLTAKPDDASMAHIEPVEKSQAEER